MSGSGVRVKSGRHKRGIIALTISLVLAATALTVPIATAPAASAATPSDFSAGNIISDSVFFDPGVMTSAQVQQFLDSQISGCASGYTCLNNYTETTATRPADAYCKAYTGVASQRASDIIWSVGQACGINPQVLIVLLQKEQSLVTDTSPTTSTYNRATGYGCPDTAPCDTQFYGFTNQVYKAARQFRVYQAWPGDFNYRPGANAILFNPNSGCGASTVYIENQATAGLYNYTPYQPNAAALANLYGIGDSCSSYGNRNFWRLFTDWFGNPQGSSLVRTSADPTVYLVTETNRYTVSSVGLYSSLLALGTPRVVSQQYLDRFPLKGEAGNLLRDSSTGAIYLAAYGSKNLFSSCALVAEWGFGGSCGAYINVTQAQLQRFVTGAPLTQFARSASTSMIYYIDNGLKRGIHSWAQVVAIAAGGSTAFADVPQPTLSMIRSGPDYLTPGSVIRTATDPALYLANGDTDAVPITTGNILNEFGLGSSVVTISPASRDAMNLLTTPLTLSIVCGADTYIAGGGKTWKVPATSGLPTTTITPETCAGIPRSDQVVTGPVFLRNSTTGEIFVITGGKKTSVPSIEQLRALNGSNPLVLIPATVATLASIPTATIVLPVATLVKGSPASVFLIDGASTRIPIPSFALAAQFGITGYTTVSDTALSGYASSAGQLTIAVTCNGVAHIAGEGKIWSVPPTHGLPTTPLDPATCAALTTSTEVTTGAVLMLQRSTGAIYLIAGGTKTHLLTSAEVTAANGANPLVLIPATDATLTSIPTKAGSPSPIAAAKLVKTALSSTVYFIDGPNRMLSVPSFALAAEFGVTGYTTVSSLAGYTASGALTPVVTCAAQAYIASGGSLWTIPSSLGLPSTALDAATCAALPVSPQVVTGAVFLRLASGEIFYVNAGVKQHVASMAKVNSLNGSGPLVLIPASTTVTGTMPTGPVLN